MPEQIPPQFEQASLSPGSRQAFDTMAAGVAMLDRPDVEQPFNISLHVAETANFQGNWMLAQEERTASSDCKAKYNALIEASLPALQEGKPGELDKPELFRSYHQALRDTYDARHAYVNAAVGYVSAWTLVKPPHQTGISGIGRRSTIFSDATTMEGTPLTNKQKDIIAAHEAYHGMIKAPIPMYEKIAAGFDRQVYYDEIVDAEGRKQSEYAVDPDELMARMAQLKNYFGMTGDEEFTKQHLDYARDHYVEDTGLDKLYVCHDADCVASDGA